MFLRAADAARDAGCFVVVSTDDSQIASTAAAAGYIVRLRDEVLAQVTVDYVVVDVAGWLDWEADVILVQPTVQPITENHIRRFIDEAEQSLHSPVSLGQENRHQLWEPTLGWMTDRVNRQDIPEPFMQELGVRWWRHPDDIGDDPAYVIPTVGLVDIDDAADYRSVAVPKKIAICAVSTPSTGRGHLHRQLAIAERLQHHHVVWIGNDLDDDTVNLLNYRGWTVTEGRLPSNPDLWIFDRLNNFTPPDVADAKVVTFEDESTQFARYRADLTVNALYSDGADWCVLRPEFTVGGYEVRERVSRIMVMFGGTDPHHVGERVAKLFPVEADLIVAADDRQIATAMRDADLLITSAGRTVYEAAAVGVPTIVMAQNLREETHAHLGAKHGNVYLGQSRLVTDRVLRDTVKALDADMGYRQELSATGVPDGKGLDRIVHAIEGLLL